VVSISFSTVRPQRESFKNGSRRCFGKVYVDDARLLKRLERVTIRQSHRSLLPLRHYVAVAAVNKQLAIAHDGSRESDAESPS
jgi:hypothetical protein